VKTLFVETDDIWTEAAKSSGAEFANILNKANVDYLVDGVVTTAKNGVKTAGADAVKGLPEQVGVEIVKEPTKYGTGRVDEAAPTHPDIERTREGGER
jgi:hypothetical protein